MDINKILEKQIEDLEVRIKNLEYELEEEKEKSRQLERLEFCFKGEAFRNKFWIICKYCGNKVDLDISHYPEGCFEDAACPHCGNQHQDD